MDEGMPNWSYRSFWKVHPIGRIIQLEAKLATSKVLVEEYKAKIEQL
jgi:hypothetical protein